VLLCGTLLVVPGLRDARLTLAAVLARFGVLVGMESEDVTFRSDDVNLSGTIVFPEQSEPIASVILVHGSGRAPRMLWLARLFASEGFAVITYDKRGVGESEGQFQGGPLAASEANLDLLAQDAAAAASVLTRHPRSRADVAEYMKSVRYSDGDVDPRTNLATLQVPGFWAFGGLRRFCYTLLVRLATKRTKDTKDPTQRAPLNACCLLAAAY
jgi:hypothetical protein